MRDRFGIVYSISMKCMVMKNVDKVTLLSRRG